MKIVYETKQYPKSHESYWHEVTEAKPCCDGMAEVDPKKIFCNEREQPEAGLELALRRSDYDDTFGFYEFTHCPWCGEEIELVQSKVIKLKAVETERTYKQKYTEYVAE